MASAVQMPAEKMFALPEKVIQFGTGVLLRALPDFMINESNKKDIFNGRVVIVKSTSTGGTEAFNSQDSLYTLCVRGITGEKIIAENYVISAVSRVLSAAQEWDKVLACAAIEQMQVVISNTTEVGLVLTQDDVNAAPPVSFPGKLLSFLYCRFKHFKGDIEKGMVIIPTELIPDNGMVLKKIVLELAGQNNMEPAFKEWIEKANYFCSSLVDRIVPGKLKPDEHQQMEISLGYEDDLAIVSEPYSLWAIETGSERVKNILSFAENNNGVVLAPDINKFRELKLRLLNGSHTFSCGLAYLAGFATVKDAMDNEPFARYIYHLIYSEIVPAIHSAQIEKEAAETFAAKVLDRFRNNFIEHKWLNITMQYSSKMNTRNTVTLKNYLSRYNKAPGNMALGMAAHILFMKAEKGVDGVYYGKINGNNYPVSDDNAAFYSTAWTADNIEIVVEKILSNQHIWQTNLALLQNFKIAVIQWLQILMASGAMAAIEMANKKAASEHEK